MANNTGDEHGNLPISKGPSRAGSLVVYGGSSKTGELLAKALEKSRQASDGIDGSMDASGAVAEVRRVRRGKFFLSKIEQQLHGSLRHCIFQTYFHGAVVGQMEHDLGQDGMWCYGAHQDFELIPECTPLNEWPEYRRTGSGFVKVGMSYLSIVRDVQRELGYEEKGEEK